jgi:serine/threonine protein kinase/DNA-binding winged helix-turn-helix (wHTH) protein
LSVGTLQFDEARQELSVDGQRRSLEAKPTALLHALLIRPGALVSKRTLIEAVWGNADHISEASLTTAMSKLRAALGESGRDIVEVVHGSGYRISLPVEVSVAREPPRLAFTFQPGEAVPGRPQWRLERVLGPAPLHDVWLARHAKTQESRVFKFADSAARLEALQREATLSRVLQSILGPRDDLVRIIEWDFDSRPAFIESTYGGLDLPAWAAAQGGLAAVALETRLAMLAQIAASVAAAHSAGVLHGDLKPANILVADDVAPPAGATSAATVGAAPLLRLVDFGVGGLSDAARGKALDISLHGLREADGGRTSGTLRYMAPEVLAGGQPTTRADIYALGVLLYQMVTGELGSALTVGWEADIADPLLRADIAGAAAGDPALRLDSASALAERLRSLPARRAEAARLAASQAAAETLAREVERARLRRPWIAAAAASMAAGMALSTVFGIRAVHDRDEARHRAHIAQAVNSFLTEDLFGRGNPARSGKADETLMEAAQAAEASIGRRLADEPLVAGSIYLSLARAFDSRTASDAARTAYQQAIDAFDRAGAPGQGEAAIARLQEAAMEVQSGQAGSMARARALIARTAPAIAGLGKRAPEARVWLDAAIAATQMVGGNVHEAQAAYLRAADHAEAMPDVFDESARLSLRQSLVLTYMRQGAWSTAEPMVRDLLDRRLVLNGPRHPSTLALQLFLAQLRIVQGHAAEALPVLNQLYPSASAVFGPDHLMTMKTLSTRGQAYMQLERYQEAEADQMAIYRLAVAKDGEHSFFALGTLADAAQAQCRAGETQAGLAAASKAYEGARAAFGAGAILTVMNRSNLAFCLIAAHQSAAAAPLLDGLDSQAAAEFMMDPTVGAQVDLMRAAIALDAGNSARAGTLLAQAAPALEAQSTDQYLRKWARALVAAQRAAAH